MPANSVAQGWAINDSKTKVDEQATELVEPAEVESVIQEVEEIQNEWNNVTGSMKTQRERLESLLQSFPGVIETSAIKALSLQMTHLEQLVSELFHESHTRATTTRARKQLIISLAALGVTVILWRAFLVLNTLK
ncbi:MAG: hypothetical protein JSW30_00435 [Dehalococcoidia bacterium]|nr:MAG: hypothetical protein JSW30_00435 [Dehalococcoidia bacterium]